MKRTKQIIAFLLSVSLAITPAPFTVTAEELPQEEQEITGTLPAPPDYVLPEWEGTYATDAPLEMVVGSTLPLSEISAQDYLSTTTVCMTTTEIIINAKDASCVLMDSAVKATVPDTPDLVTYMTNTADQTDKEPAKNQDR